MTMTKTDPNEPVTRGILDEAVEAILKGMDKMVRRLGSEMNSRFEEVDERLKKIEIELTHVKDTVNGLKADLSDTPLTQGIRGSESQG
jgi:hypothetical protein